MKDFESVYNFIQKLSDRDSASPEILALKGVEEIGELAAALFKESGYKPTDEEPYTIRMNQLEEGCDAIICMLAVLDKKNFTMEQIINMLGSKCGKWEETLNKRDI